MLSFKTTFSLSSLTFIKRLFSSSSLSGTNVLWSAYLRLLIFLPTMLIPAYILSSSAFIMMYTAYKLHKQSDNIQPWGTPSPNLEPVCCSMSSSNCCFLTYIQISQESGQVIWYSHLFQNLPQFVGTHTVRGFGIVNKAVIDVLLELSVFFVCMFVCLFFLMIQQMLAIWPLVPLPFLNPAWTSGISRFTYCWNLT